MADNNTTPTTTDERLEEIKKFKEKYRKAMVAFKYGKYLSDSWPSILISGQTIFKSTVEVANKSRGVPPKGIIPTEISITVDGISDITIGEAFVLQRGILPKKYDDFGFIITGVDQGIKNNRWYTTIRAQTFNIKELTEQEKADNKALIEKEGFY